jgi:hypothetical protein
MWVENVSCVSVNDLGKKQPGYVVVPVGRRSDRSRPLSGDGEVFGFPSGFKWTLVVFKIS